MNPLSRKELYVDLQNKEIIDNFFLEEEYLASLGYKLYADLNSDEKQKVDEILENINDYSNIVISLLSTDYYTSLAFLLKKPFIRKDYEFIRKLEEHYNMLLDYEEKLREVIYLIKNSNNMNMYELLLANNISFLSFFCLQNEIISDDLSLLNKGKYVDSDVYSYENLNRTLNANFISLRNLAKNKRKN